MNLTRTDDGDRMLRWLEVTTARWPRGVTLTPRETKLVESYIDAGLVEQGDGGANFWRITATGRDVKNRILNDACGKEGGT